MSVYGNFAKNFVNSGGSRGGAIFESSEEFNTLVIESIMSSYINESEDDDSIFIDDIVEEGANLDYRAAFKSGRKKYKEAFKKAKKAYKSGNISDAKKYIKEADRALADIEKILKKVDSTVGSAIFGFFAYGLLNMAEMIVPYSLMVTGMGVSSAGVNKIFSAGAAADIDSAAKTISNGLKTAGAGGVISSVGSVAGFVQAIIITVRMLIQLVNDIKDDKTSTEQALNLYRNKLITYTKDMRKHLSKLENKIGK